MSTSPRISTSGLTGTHGGPSHRVSAASALELLRHSLPPQSLVGALGRRSPPELAHIGWPRVASAIGASFSYEIHIDKPGKLMQPQPDARSRFDANGGIYRTLLLWHSLPQPLSKHSSCGSLPESRHTCPPAYLVLVALRSHASTSAAALRRISNNVAPRQGKRRHIASHRQQGHVAVASSVSACQAAFPRKAQALPRHHAATPLQPVTPPIGRTWQNRHVRHPGFARLWRPMLPNYSTKRSHAHRVDAVSLLLRQIAPLASVRRLCTAVVATANGTRIGIVLSPKTLLLRAPHVACAARFLAANSRAIVFDPSTTHPKCLYASTSLGRSASVSRLAFPSCWDWCSVRFMARTPAPCNHKTASVFPGLHSCSKSPPNNQVIHVRGILELDQIADVLSREEAIAASST